MSLRRGAFRGRGAGEVHGARLQLHDVRDDRIPAPHRAEVEVPPATGRRKPRDLHLQYRRGEAQVLQDMRHQIVLRAALEPRRHRRQRALPGRRARWDGDRAVRRQELGGARERARAPQQGMTGPLPTQGRHFGADQLPLNQLYPWSSQYPPGYVLVTKISMMCFGFLKPSLVGIRSFMGKPYFGGRIWPPYLKASSVCGCSAVAMSIDV